MVNRIVYMHSYELDWRPSGRSFLRSTAAWHQVNACEFITYSSDSELNLWALLQALALHHSWTLRPIDFRWPLFVFLTYIIGSTTRFARSFKHTILLMDMRPHSALRWLQFSHCATFDTSYSPWKIFSASLNPTLQHQSYQTCGMLPWDAPDNLHNHMFGTLKKATSISQMQVEHQLNVRCARHTAPLLYSI